MFRSAERGVINGGVTDVLHQKDNCRMHPGTHLSMIIRKKIVP